MNRFCLKFQDWPFDTDPSTTDLKTDIRVYALITIMYYTRCMSHFSIAMTNYMPCQCTFTQCILFCPLPEIKPPLLFKRVFFLFQYCSKCCWYSPNKMLLWLCMEFKNNLCYRWWRSMITYRKHYLNTIQNNLHFRHEYSVT